MAIRQIVKVGDNILRSKSFPVTEYDQGLATLLDDMQETLTLAAGAGLAAPQVGVLKRVFIVCIDGVNFIEFVNPTIIKQSGCELSEEGCLSIPGFSAELERPKKVTVSAFDRTGKPFTMDCTGFMARAICHETDHLDGILFTDRLAEGENV